MTTLRFGNLARKLACTADDFDNEVEVRLNALEALDECKIDYDDMEFVAIRMRSILAYEERPMLRRAARDVLEALHDLEVNMDDARSRRAYV